MVLMLVIACSVRAFNVSSHYQTFEAVRCGGNVSRKVENFNLSNVTTALQQNYPLRNSRGASLRGFVDVKVMGDSYSDYYCTSSNTSNTNLTCYKDNSHFVCNCTNKEDFVYLYQKCIIVQRTKSRRRLTSWVQYFLVPLDFVGRSV